MLELRVHPERPVRLLDEWAASRHERYDGSEVLSDSSWGAPTHSKACHRSSLGSSFLSACPPSLFVFRSAGAPRNHYSISSTAIRRGA